MRHVVAVSWLSLAPVAAAVGVFALAGETVVRRVLGSSYGGGTGAELGRLVVYLAPWMVASVAFSVAFPLALRSGRARWLPLLALVALVVQVLVEWRARAAFGLGGLAAGLAVDDRARAARAAAASVRSARRPGRRSCGARLRRSRCRRLRAAAPRARAGRSGRSGLVLYSLRPGALASSRPAARVGVPSDVVVTSARCTPEAPRAPRRPDAARQEPRPRLGARRPGGAALPERRALAGRGARLRGSRLPLLVQPAEPRHRVAADRRGGAALPARA